MRAGRGHYIADRRLEIAAGLALFAAGGLLLRDAFEGRAQPQPWWLRPVSWW